MLFRSDRKSTRLNSSHTIISYAVFCLKKKKKQQLDARLEREEEVLRGTRGRAAPARRPPGCTVPRPAVVRPTGPVQRCAFFFKRTGPPPTSPLSPPPPLSL